MLTLPASQQLDAAPCSWVALSEEVIVLDLLPCDSCAAIEGKFFSYGVECSRGWCDTSHFQLHRHPIGSLRRYQGAVGSRTICTVAGGALGRQGGVLRHSVPSAIRRSDQFLKRRFDRGVSTEHWSVNWCGSFGVLYDSTLAPPFLSPYEIPDVPDSFGPGESEDVRQSRWVNRHHSGIGSIQVLLKQAERIMWAYDRSAMEVNCALMDVFKVQHPSLARAAASCAFLSAMISHNWSNTAHCKAGLNAEASLSIMLVFGEPVTFLFPEYGVRLLLKHGDVAWFNAEMVHCCEVVDCARGSSYLLTGYILNRCVNGSIVHTGASHCILEGTLSSQGEPNTVPSMLPSHCVQGGIPVQCAAPTDAVDNITDSATGLLSVSSEEFLCAADDDESDGEEPHQSSPQIGDIVTVLCNGAGNAASFWCSATVCDVRHFPDWGFDASEHHLKYQDGVQQWEQLAGLEWYVLDHVVGVVHVDETRDAEDHTVLFTNAALEGHPVRVWIPRENDGVSLSTGEHVLRAGVWFAAELRGVETRSGEVWSEIHYVDGWADTLLTRLSFVASDCLNGQLYDPRSDGRTVTGGPKALSGSLQQRLQQMVSRDVVLLDSVGLWPSMHYDHSLHRWLGGARSLTPKVSHSYPVEGALHLCVGGGGMVQTTEALGIPTWMIHDCMVTPGVDCLKFVGGQLEGSVVSPLSVLGVDADLTLRSGCRKVLSEAKRHWGSRHRRPELAMMGFPCTPFCKPSNRTGIHHPLARIALLLVETLLDPLEAFSDVVPDVFIFENSDELVDHPVHQEFTRDLVALLEQRYPVIRMTVGQELVYGYIGGDGQTFPANQMRSRFYMLCCLNDAAGERWSPPQPNASPAGLRQIVSAATILSSHHPELNQHLSITQSALRKRWEARKSDLAEAAKHNLRSRRQHRMFPGGHSLTHGGTMRVYSCKSARWVNAITTRSHCGGACNSVVLWTGHDKFVLPDDTLDWDQIVWCPHSEWGMRCLSWAEKAVLFHFDASRIRMVVKVLREKQSGWLGLLRHVFGVGVGAGYCLAFTHSAIAASRGVSVENKSLPSYVHPTLQMSSIKDRFAVGGTSLYEMYYLVDAAGEIWTPQWGIANNLPLS